MLKALGGRGIGKLIIYTENVTEAFNPRIVRLVCRDIYTYSRKPCIVCIPLRPLPLPYQSYWLPCSLSRKELDGFV